MKNFYNGVSDAFAFPVCLFVIYGSTTLKNTVIRTILLNGLLFFIWNMFWLVVTNIVMPWMDHYLMQYNVTCPAFLMSYMLTRKWHQDIATRSFHIFVGQPTAEQTSIPKIIMNAAQDAYRVIFLTNYIFHACLVYFVPYIGTTMSFILFTFLTSYFAFEQKWIHKNWLLHKRIEYIESHWLYFFGFGFPLTLITFLQPRILLSLGGFSIVFPLLIIMATRAKPVKNVEQSNPIAKHWLFPSSLPVFYFASLCSSACITCIKYRREKNLEQKSK